MIPIRDLHPTRNRPWLVWTLIALNVVAFGWQFLLDSQGELVGQQFVERFGIVPYWLTRLELGSTVTLVTHMFLHGGFLHLAGNMWFLHVFGDNVEDDMGPGRFLAFYLLCGFAAAGAQVAIDPESFVPMVGASGAIAGVLAAYVTLYPRARVLTLIPLLVVFFFREIPAVVFILVWFGYQLLMGFTALGQITQQSGGVAFFAHIGGFLAGLVLVHVFRRRSKRLPTHGFRPPSVRPYPEGWRPREYD